MGAENGALPMARVRKFIRQATQGRWDDMLWGQMKAVVRTLNDDDVPAQLKVMCLEFMAMACLEDRVRAVDAFDELGDFEKYLAQLEGIDPNLATDLHQHIMTMTYAVANFSLSAPDLLELARNDVSLAVHLLAAPMRDRDNPIRLVAACLATLRDLTTADAYFRSNFEGADTETVHMPDLAKRYTRFVGRLTVSCASARLLHDLAAFLRPYVQQAVVRRARFHGGPVTSRHTPHVHAAMQATFAVVEAMLRYGGAAAAEIRMQMATKTQFMQHLVWPYMELALGAASDAAAGDGDGEEGMTLLPALRGALRCMAITTYKTRLFRGLFRANNPTRTILRNPRLAADPMVVALLVKVNVNIDSLAPPTTSPIRGAPAKRGSPQRRWSTAGQGAGGEGIAPLLPSMRDASGDGGEDDASDSSSSSDPDSGSDADSREETGLALHRSPATPGARDRTRRRHGSRAERVRALKAGKRAGGSPFGADSTTSKSFTLRGAALPGNAWAGGAATTVADAFGVGPALRAAMEAMTEAARAHMFGLLASPPADGVPVTANCPTHQALQFAFSPFHFQLDRIATDASPPPSPPTDDRRAVPRSRRAEGKAGEGKAGGAPAQSPSVSREAAAAARALVRAAGVPDVSAGARKERPRSEQPRGAAGATARAPAATPAAAAVAAAAAATPPRPVASAAVPPAFASALAGYDQLVGDLLHPSEVEPVRRARHHLAPLQGGGSAGRPAAAAGSRLGKPVLGGAGAHPRTGK